MTWRAAPRRGLFVLGVRNDADHEQNVAFLDLDCTGPNPYLRDGNGNGAYVFVCECDGMPVGTISTGFVAADINNPN